MIFETEKEAIEWLEKNKIHFTSDESGFTFEIGKAIYLRQKFTNDLTSHLKNESVNANLQKNSVETFLGAVNMLAEDLVPEKLKPEHGS